MTEDEAKTKTCHKTLAALGGSDGVPSWHSPAPCIGSACMAWRWDLDGFDLEFDEHGPLRVRKTKLAHGHCGLASKP